MEYVIPVPPIPSLDVVGNSARFPVHRIYCVGQNYARGDQETAEDPRRDLPYFSTKPADAVVASGTGIPYPTLTDDLEYEIELVVAIGVGGHDLAASDASSHIYGYAVGIDLTRRDLQLAARNAGQPWEVGKGFDQSAPCSVIHPVTAIGHPNRGAIWLDVNGTRRQDGDLADLFWPVPELIAHLSELFTLQPGDLIFTGTPSGTGPVVRGDVLTGGVAGIDEIEISIV